MNKTIPSRDHKRSLTAMLSNVLLVATISSFLLSMQVIKEDVFGQTSHLNPNGEYAVPFAGKTGEYEGVPPMEPDDECDESGECEWGDNGGEKGGEREAVPPMPPSYRCQPGECEPGRHGNGESLKIITPRELIYNLLMPGADGSIR